MRLVATTVRPRAFPALSPSTWGGQWTQVLPPVFWAEGLNLRSVGEPQSVRTCIVSHKWAFWGRAPRLPPSSWCRAHPPSGKFMQTAEVAVWSSFSWGVSIQGP